MASTTGPLSYLKDDGSLTTDNTTMSSSMSSLKGNKTENKSTLDVDDFLQLLVAEMQYQDPLEPTDNTQYMAQMATFTQVEATTQMQNTTEQNMASNLVGKTVIMSTNLTSSGYIAGAVNYWESIEGTIYLGIGDKLYDIADLETVMDEDYYKQWSGSGTTDTTDKTDGTEKPADEDKTDNTEKPADDQDKTDDTEKPAET